jgi:hypothetical protein
MKWYLSSMLGGMGGWIMSRLGYLPEKILSQSPSVLTKESHYIGDFWEEIQEKGEQAEMQTHQHTHTQTHRQNGDFWEEIQDKGEQAVKDKEWHRRHLQCVCKLLLHAKVCTLYAYNGCVFVSVVLRVVIICIQFLHYVYVTGVRLWMWVLSVLGSR